MNKFKDSLFWTNYKKFDKVKEMIFNRDLQTSMRSLGDSVIYWRLFQEYKFSNILEIGVYQGLTAGLMLEASDNVSSYTGIDINLRLDIFKDIWKDYLTPTTFYEQSSLDFNFDQSKQYDFILVDGDHSYNGAITDLTNVKNLLSKDGVLAIDDYFYPAVQQAIEEFRSTTDMVPFLQTDQTEFWHYATTDRSEFLDNLFTDPIHNFIYLYNINNDRTVKALTIKALNENVDFFNDVVTHYDI